MAEYFLYSRATQTISIQHYFFFISKFSIFYFIFNFFVTNNFPSFQFSSWTELNHMHIIIISFCAIRRRLSFILCTYDVRTWWLYIYISFVQIIVALPRCVQGHHETTMDEKCKRDNVAWCWRWLMIDDDDGYMYKREKDTKLKKITF